ncbi:MAG: restriction endonuclease FokI C-terminal domain-containing protein [Bacteroidales bacterium]|nr:restriction endonuclease FokI C-terminal domain-containing protein [Bacteroidales bacterium]MDD4217764.1 restriction endonuclease FokI C-terminal domain-containing protein [Bacteroidales bacterium]MDY0142160.1 restriction endonuclease FokI C-terminal domain-containing protein [Bacteroidales bacterium]
MNRPRGWIQDSGNLDNMIRVVELFDKNSATHKNLISTHIPNKIEDISKKTQLIENLKTTLVNFNSLVGTRTSNDKVDSIIQCLISGQNRLGIVDWACDNFVRFAYTLNFIAYNETFDSFSITNFGLELTQATDDEKYEVLKIALKKYPPVVRVLELLYNQYENQPQIPSLTKFEIGKNLGFKGEDGFTTYSQNVFIQALNTAETVKERNKIRQNWEGSSDKYARMICGWLMHNKIAWVTRNKKDVEIQIGNEKYDAKLQSYQITLEGIKEFRSCRAYSRNPGTIKNVSFEMLATKGADKNYLRTRRTYILKAIQLNKTIEQIQQYLENKNLSNISEQTIKDDIKNFSRIGLEISFSCEKYKLKDVIELLEIPDSVSQQNITPSILESTKQTLREELNCLDHEYLDILDFSIAGRKSAIQFEVRITELLNQIIIAKHLAGGSRPEIIGYNPKHKPEDCIIMDSKSYKDGFKIPASERDKMIRYIEEYKEKDENLNSNKWWANFKSPDYPNKEVKFSFVSSAFIGNYLSQLTYIRNRTGINGCAVTTETLLRKVNNVLNKNCDYELTNFFEDLGCNNLVK